MPCIFLSNQPETSNKSAPQTPDIMMKIMKKSLKFVTVKPKMLGKWLAMPNSSNFTNCSAVAVAAPFKMSGRLLIPASAAFLNSPAPAG